MRHFLSGTELDALLSFATVAQTRNLRQAAALLHISEPPLSRKITRLEQSLGLRLFIRRHDGLELTEAGQEALEIVRPLIAAAQSAQRRLAEISRVEAHQIAIGLTTAIEQGVFVPLLTALKAELPCRLRIQRAESPVLAREVLKGMLQAAVVALPLDSPGLCKKQLSRRERIKALLPACWPECYQEEVRLADLNGRPLFWFQRAKNPAWFDWMQTVFTERGYEPRHVGEPPEHDVLLARVAAGEGMALLPESFARIQRDGVRFRNLEDEGMALQLGVVWKDSSSLVEKIVEIFTNGMENYVERWR